MEVSPGKIYSTMYLATNNTSSNIVGQAVPSVSPNEASKYLKKIECFCFEEQTFKPGEVTNLPLYFAIDEKMPKRIKDLRENIKEAKNHQIFSVKFKLFIHNGHH